MVSASSSRAVPSRQLSSSSISGEMPKGTVTSSDSECELYRWNLGCFIVQVCSCFCALMDEKYGQMGIRAGKKINVHVVYMRQKAGQRYTTPREVSHFQ